MAWFELHQELCAHPKTKRLAKSLGICLPQAVGHCVCLWTWAMSYAQNGVLTDYGQDGIADAAQWPGDPDAFVSAMIECGVGDKPGFIEWTSEDGLIIHDWEDYRRSKSNPRLSPSLWIEMRRTVFTRDDFTCQYCGKRGVRLECDHVTPLSRGGSNELSNLATACFSCNRSKRDKTVEEWKNRNG